MSTHSLQAFKGGIDNLNINRLVAGLRERNSRRRAFRGAMTQAYTTCARHYHPKWAAYFLDAEFQMLGEGRLRECYLQGTVCMGPAELARFWADQIKWVSEEAKRRYTAELVPVADRFLRVLVLELSDRDVSG